MYWPKNAKKITTINLGYNKLIVLTKTKFLELFDPKSRFLRTNIDGPVEFIIT